MQCLQCEKARASKYWLCSKCYHKRKLKTRTVRKFNNKVLACVPSEILFAKQVKKLLNT